MALLAQIDTKRCPLVILVHKSHGKVRVTVFVELFWNGLAIKTPGVSKGDLGQTGGMAQTVHLRMHEMDQVTAPCVNTAPQ